MNRKIKLSIGDKVKIVNYGHRILENGKLKDFI